MNGQKVVKVFCHEQAGIEKFNELLKLELFNIERNPEQKLVVFSESVETAVELALRSLSERELLVVSRFFGLEGSHETMAEIAEDMGLKRERVRQIRNHAIRRLKKVYWQKLKAVRG